MEMEEGGAEDDGGWRLGMTPAEGGGGPLGGRTVLKGWEEKDGCCGSPLGCDEEGAEEEEECGGSGGAEGGWWLADDGRL